MQGEAHREVESPEHEQGAPPAHRCNEELRYWHENRTGKPAHEGERRNATAIIRPKSGRDDGKRWLIQHPGHTDTNERPEQIEHPRCLHPSPGQQEQPPHQGAKGHDASAAVTVNPGADGKRYHPRAE